MPQKMEFADDMEERKEDEEMGKGEVRWEESGEVIGRDL